MARSTPEEARALYEGMRQSALCCTLERCGLDPALFAGGAVFGAIMDFTVSDGRFVTLFCCYEEGPGTYVHVGLYTTSGFSIDRKSVV